MCQLYGQPVGEYSHCCMQCPQYKNSCLPIVGYGGYIFGECDFSFCEYCPCYSECEDIWGKGVDEVKLVNYESRTLIYQNVRSNRQQTPDTFTKTQFLILCRLIRQKKITRLFFEFLLIQLYGFKDWKKLNYNQMYEVIGILTHWDYKEERLTRHE